MKYEMEVSGVRKIHTPKIVAGRVQEPVEPPNDAIDPDDPGDRIDEIWSWCVIQDCRPITKIGRLFSKKPGRQYRSAPARLSQLHLVTDAATSDFTEPTSPYSPTDTSSSSACTTTKPTESASTAFPSLTPTPTPVSSLRRSFRKARTRTLGPASPDSTRMASRARTGVRASPPSSSHCRRTSALAHNSFYL